MRHTTLTVLIGTALLLTACSNTDDTAPPPTPTPSPAATTTATATTPSPPAMPQAAKAHTEAGAKAFVEYLWLLADSLGRVPDPETIRPLFEEGCTGCDGVLRLLTDLKNGHGVLRGGGTTLSRFRVHDRQFGGQPATEVSVDVASDPSVADYPGTAKDVDYPGGKRRTMFLVSYRSGTWRVTTWQPL